MWRNIFRIPSLTRHLSGGRPLHAMESVYLRLVEGEEKFDISLKYPQSAHKEREFNFKRYQNEPLSTTYERMQASFAKKIGKKNKKKGANDQSWENSTGPMSIVLFRGNEPWEHSVINKTAWTYPESFLLIGERKYKVLLNPPIVTTLKLPKCLMAGYPIVPIVNMEFCVVRECIFSWYRERRATLQPPGQSERKRPRSNSDEITYVFLDTCYIYTPCDEDIGNKLKVVCLPSDGTRHGLEVECFSKSTVIQGPASCPFERRHIMTKHPCDENSIRMVSYNILADVYADSEYSRNYLFPQCPPDKLDINYRKYLIVKEILGYNADIICLQEVDEKIFTGDLVPIMDTIGFEGKYCGKFKNQINNGNGENNLKEYKQSGGDNAEQPTAEPMDDGEAQESVGKKVEIKATGSVKEGCATFFRKSKFKLLEQFDGNVTEILKKDEAFWAQIFPNVVLTKYLEDRTTVVQASLLENIDNARRKVLVVTSHFFFHPRANNIRLLQTLGCVKHIEAILEKYKHEDISVIFCGDFNAAPINAVHELLTKGKVRGTHADWYSGGKDGFVANMDIETNLTFTSACGYPQYTNYVAAFTGCLDYIYTDSKMKTQRVIPLPSHEEVTEFTCLPNAVFPSDHLALVCDLTWVENNT